jgi:endo-1,4-beta-xylanase
MSISLLQPLRFVKKNWRIVILLVIGIAVGLTVYLIQNQRATINKAASTYAYIRQSVYSVDGQTGWSRDCRLESNGPNFNACTPWNGPNNISSLRGGTGESYSAYGAFTFTKNNQQTIRQTLYSKDGKSAWNRDCPVYLWGVEFSECTAWPAAINITALRGVGNEAYGGFTAFTYVVNGQTKLRHSIVSLDGKSSWYRECLIGASGPEQCSPTWTGTDNNLTNVRGIGNESYSSSSSIVYSVSAQQTLRQVIVTSAGNQGFFRTCPISLTTGVQFTTPPCSGWIDMNIGSLRGVGGESYGSYEEFIYTSQIDLIPTLTNYSSRSGVPAFGVAVGSIAANQFSDSGYTNALQKYGYKIIVPENEMKMKYTEPNQPGVFDFTLMDQIVDFAQAHNLQVQGLPLVWHNQLPTWLTSGSFTRTQLITIMKNHIETVMSRYKGKITTWEVVNEAIGEDGTMRKSIWYTGIGPDYIDLAFRFAHEVDPNAKLMYNDNTNEALVGKSDAVYNLVKGLRQRKVPVSIVGLQSHFVLGSYTPSLQDMSTNIARLAALGVEANITEIDVSIGSYPGSAAQLSAQADMYKSAAIACFNAPNCKEFVTWGVLDKYSYSYLSSQGKDAPDLLDNNYLPKPAYWAIAPYVGITLTPTPIEQGPIGNFDKIDINGVAYGWTADPNNISQSISVDFYMDGQTGQGGTKIGSVIANVPRPDVNQAGYPGDHGFSFTIPLQYRTGTHSLYVYGIDTGAGPNTVLGGSPRQIPSITPTPSYTNTPTPTSTKTPTPTATKSLTPTPTSTKSPTPTPTSTGTRTPTPTAITKTPTPTSTATNTTVQPVPGDANGDRKVDGVDYSIWLSRYGTPSSGVSNGDFNSDGKVDGIDFVVWLNHYGYGL